MEAACALLLRLFVSGAPPGARTLRPTSCTWNGGSPRSGVPPGRCPRCRSTGSPAAVNVSPGHLSRLTRAAFGIGPVAAVEAARLHRAAALLTRSNLTVGQVAQACGFGSPFYLSRRFRAAFGRPPTAYRRDPIARPPLPGQSPAQAAALANWCARTQSP